jgi:hypothetical protein
MYDNIYTCKYCKRNGNKDDFYTLLNDKNKYYEYECLDESECKKIYNKIIENERIKNYVKKPFENEFDKNNNPNNKAYLNKKQKFELLYDIKYDDIELLNYEDPNNDKYKYYEYTYKNIIKDNIIDDYIHCIFKWDILSKKWKLLDNNYNEYKYIEFALGRYFTDFVESQ